MLFSNPKELQHAQVGVPYNLELSAQKSFYLSPVASQ